MYIILPGFFVALCTYVPYIPYPLSLSPSDPTPFLYDRQIEAAATGFDSIRYIQYSYIAKFRESINSTHGCRGPKRYMMYSGGKRRQSHDHNGK